MRVLEVGLDVFEERPGGVSRYFSELMTAGPGVGLDLRGLAVGHGQRLNGAIRAFARPEATVLERMLAARSAIERELREFRPSVVASHFAQHAWPGLDSIDVPLVVHFHGPWAFEGAAERMSRPGQLIKRWIETQVYKRSQASIVLSEAFRRILVASYGISEDRVLVIPGGVDCDRYNVDLDRQQARARLGWPSDRPVVLTVRRLVHRVGMDTAISAVAKVVKDMPELLLIIGGTGPLAGDLARQVEDLGLSRNVRLVGKIADDDLPVAYRAADISLVPTAALEGFGLVAVESLASGTPALVTPVGGLPEVVAPLEPELVLADKGADAIADGIVRAFRGGTRMPSTEQCRRFAVERYDWSSVAPKIAAAYRSVL